MVKHELKKYGEKLFNLTYCWCRTTADRECTAYSEPRCTGASGCTTLYSTNLFYPGKGGSPTLLLILE